MTVLTTGLARCSRRASRNSRQEHPGVPADYTWELREKPLAGRLAAAIDGWGHNHAVVNLALAGELVPVDACRECVGVIVEYAFEAEVAGTASPR